MKLGVKGRIHSIQSLGAVDGPGVRSVVFMQGCPLRCGYCHNPDTWEPGGGEEMEAAAVFAKVRRFAPYFGPEGGITVSGGEPLMQAGFVRELFSLCKGEGLHTALDTSGCLWGPETEALLAVTDLVLLDIKMTREEDYREYVGCAMERPLSFLRELEARSIPAWIRQVIVPGVNDTEESIGRLAGLLRGFTCVKKVELLPFHKICAAKYEGLGIPFAFDQYPAAKAEEVRHLQEKLDAGLSELPSDC